MEDEEWKKLPVEDRCTHKAWKARVNGYEEVTKLFRQIDDEKSPEFAKYLGLVKKFVSDTNAMGQEKGLEATLAFVENYAHAGKTVGEVMSGIVGKCLAAARTKTREIAVQVTLMYVEIEKQEAVIEELLKGTEQKNPKIVAACVNTITLALKEFGAKVVNVKPLIKKISVLFAERDKAVRDEARNMVIEIYRWIGPALRSQLSNLQPVQVTELEAEFAKIDGQKAAPTRYLRSQQQRQAKIAAETVEAEDNEEPDEGDGFVQVDAYDIAEPVDILSKLPKDFYEKLEAKKWQDRKEALEALEVLLKAPKLENGDYGDLVRALKRIIQKDSNVVVVAQAVRCLAALASGLKKRFQTYGNVCVSALLEKFKEKKQSVVVALREATDAVYISVTIESILEDVLEALNNKNPSVKSETSLFLARAFLKTQASVLNKKLLKAYTGALIKNINEPDPTVRDSSSEALGTLMKLVGEKAIAPFLVEVEKDSLKMTKIKESCDKAVITTKAASPKKERATSAASKTPSSQNNSGEPPTKPVRRPTTAKKKTTILSGSATIVKSKAKPERPAERELSDDEVEEIVSSIFSTETLGGLADSNWKVRLTAMEDFLMHLQTMESSTIPTQALIKVLNRKPGLKDTNFQVLKARLDAIKYLAQHCTFSNVTADLCLTDVIEKLGDAKNGTNAGEALTAITEVTSLSYVGSHLTEFVFGQKNPKVLQESLLWLAGAIKEFGFVNMNTKALIDDSKKALGSINPGVRASAIALVGTLYLYVGPALHTFFENERPALRDQINAECEKYENERPPLPTRGSVKSASSDALNQDYEGVGEPNTATQDLIPRIDISSQITEGLINELSDKNWKVRNEALTKVATILSDAKFIKPNISELAQALALRLVDSNGKIAQTTLTICENIATAMGPPCKQYIRALLPGFLQGLGDGKAWIRTSSVTCLNAFGDQGGYKEFFEGEMIGDALKTGSPTLRSELWCWLGEKLPKIKSVSKDELMICLPYLYTNLEDRNADVRKNAQEAVLGFMMHISYMTMAKNAEKLKPGSKVVVIAALDKAKPYMPIEPILKKADHKEDKAVRGTKPVGTSKNAVKPKAGAALAKPTANRKKEEDVDTSPLLMLNNMKHQRTIDESKLKILKWNFTSPREEFVELLRDQMAAANINKSLMQNMFHSDFRFHIKAIDSLLDDVYDNGQALIANLDLILKWLTLRFFDTNPSVLLRELEYLHAVFNFLIENKYVLHENEASSFIPYLILKAGDPKDAVRNGVRALFRQICNVFPVSKLFSYIMEGLKSKNARQRSECLELMSSLIEEYGVTICLPTPAACLKEIAKQISDRDNAVRNAALNCCVQAFYVVGEKVYKMVGQISDKDMSLLEERIKRAVKKPPPPKIAKIDPIVRATEPENRDNNEEQDEQSGEDDIVEEETTMTLAPLPSQVTQEHHVESTGPFKFDPEYMKQLDSIKPIDIKPDLKVFNLDYLKEEISIPSISDVRATVMPLSPPKPIQSNHVFVRKNLAQRSNSSEQDLVLEKTIKQVGSASLTSALQAIEQMQELFQSTNKGSVIVDYEDQFMIAVTVQLKMLNSLDPTLDNTVYAVYRAILTVLNAFYVNKLLGRKLSVEVLRDIISELITSLVEGKLERFPEGEAYIRVVNLHCVKIIERSDHTNITCALLKLLYNCINVDKIPRFTDLVNKCLWKVIKIMPTWPDEIDHDSILMEAHIFLKDFPTSWWKNKAINTPLRTVKTVLHTMVKIKGGSLMLHLSKIPNIGESEIETYIMRLLKSAKLEEVKQVPLKSDTSSATRRSLSRSTHASLTDIFQKIGHKAETNEGLSLLYDFLQQHPEADIEPFLKRSSQFFQDYIDKGLKQIEESRKNLPVKIIKKVSEQTLTNASGNNPADSKDAEYWRGRLDMWQKVWEDAISRSSSN